MTSTEPAYCIAPFTDFSISNNVAHPCACDTWVNRKFWFNHNINIPNDTIQTLNSPIMSMFREGIRRLDSSICFKDSCPHKKLYTIEDIQNNKPNLPYNVKQAIVDFLTYKTYTYSELPCNYKLDYDGSCNLACPTCREAHHIAPASDFYIPYTLNVAPILPYAQTIVITGVGDPFASPHFKHILNTELPVSSLFSDLSIMTNGVLFNEENYEHIYYKEKLHNVYISIDAFKESTYKKVRIGGCWDTLHKNIQFLLNLRSDGKIHKLYVNFVIQKANLYETEDFIDWAIYNNFDGVFLNTPWVFGTNELSIRSMSVHIQGSAEYTKYCQVLDILKGKQIKIVYSHNPLKG